MSLERAILIGGLYDGTVAQMPAIVPRIRMPDRAPDPGFVAGFVAGWSSPLLLVLEYDLELDETGHPSRDDTGRIRYRVQPPERVTLP